MDKWLQWNHEVVLWFSASARTLIGEAKLDFARRAGTPTYREIAAGSDADPNSKATFDVDCAGWQETWENVLLDARDRRDPRDEKGNLDERYMYTHDNSQ